MYYKSIIRMMPEKDRTEEGAVAAAVVKAPPNLYVLFLHCCTFWLGIAANFRSNHETQVIVVVCPVGGHPIVI